MGSTLGVVGGSDNCPLWVACHSHRMRAHVQPGKMKCGSTETAGGSFLHSLEFTKLAFIYSQGCISHTAVNGGPVVLLLGYFTELQAILYFSRQNVPDAVS